MQRGKALIEVRQDFGALLKEGGPKAIEFRRR
jgi:hypothetical protein